MVECKKFMAETKKEHKSMHKKLFGKVKSLFRKKETDLENNSIENHVEESKKERAVSIADDQINMLLDDNKPVKI